MITLNSTAANDQRAKACQRSWYRRYFAAKGRSDSAAPNAERASARWPRFQRPLASTRFSITRPSSVRRSAALGLTENTRVRGKLLRDYAAAEDLLGSASVA